jgi:histone-lysine N-methyltransferase SETMAR
MWVPHALTDSHKVKRQELAVQIWKRLNLAQAHQFANVITGDESWILFENPHKQQWIDKGADRPTAPKQTIATRKALLTVFFSAQHVWIVHVLEEKETMTAATFIEKILQPLAAKIGAATPALPKPLLLHFDNASPHKAKVTQEAIERLGFEVIEHPPYSPDLAPADFFLFSTLKRKLRGCRFHSATEVKQVVTQKLTEIRRESWSRTFYNWMFRCHCVNVSAGEYF